ncbi:DUF1444 family protein [Methylobacterium sp. A54F]
MNAPAARPSRRSILGFGLGFGLGLLLPAAARADALTDGRFHREVAGILRAVRPDARIIPDPDPLQIRIDRQTLYLGDLYKTVEGLAPADRRRTIETHLTRALAAACGPRCGGEGPSFAEAKARLRIQLSSKAALGGTDLLVHRPFSDQLAVTYVLDDKDRYQYVTRAMFEDWGIEAAALEGQASANLETASADADISLAVADGVPVLAMVMTGDGYDAARLLLPGYLGSLRRALKADALTVAAPTRDLLMAWPADSPARAAFAADVRAQMRRGPYGRSDELFRSDAAGLRPLAGRELTDHGR